MVAYRPGPHRAAVGGPALDAERGAVVEACMLLEAGGALTARALGIEGLADLDREAEEARRNLAPGLLSLRRSRD